MLYIELVSRQKQLEWSQGADIKESGSNIESLLSTGDRPVDQGEKELIELRLAI